MEEMHCSKSSCVVKTIALLILFLAAWFTLAFDHHMVWPGKCTGISLNIEKGEVVSATSLGKDVIALSVNFPDQGVTKVILYDYCSGHVISSVEANR